MWAVDKRMVDIKKEEHGVGKNEDQRLHIKYSGLLCGSVIGVR